MEVMLFSGVLDLPWWGVIAVVLGLTHVTIVAVTVFLHRHQAHRALTLHPIASHFFRFWLWATTGMVTKEWAAVHRKHHAKCDTPDDPHSPQVLGINRVLWAGVFLYVKEANRPETIERYGHGTPDDWLERNLYSRYQSLGLILMGVVDVVLFGIVPGLLVLATQIAWIPFWAAGVINGIGHYWGYRHWPTPDASTNIVPIGILIGGEELHNNHHAYPTSAKLSVQVVRVRHRLAVHPPLAALGLAQVRHVAPTAHFAATKSAVDPQTLQAVIACRYDVLAKYAKSLKRIYAEEVAKLRRVAPEDARALQSAEARAAGARREDAARGRAREARRSAAEVGRAADDVRDAPRARRGMGALHRHARAARQAAAGLVPARRGQRHRVARRVLAAAASLRLTRVPAVGMRATHEVFNQVPPLVDFNAFDGDTALKEGVAHAGAAWAIPQLSEYGARTGSAEVTRWGFEANEFKPRLVSHDRHGRRVDLVEYHDSYHRLMAMALQEGLHSAPWVDAGAGRARRPRGPGLPAGAGRRRARLPGDDDLRRGADARDDTGARPRVAAPGPRQRLRPARRAARRKEGASRSAWG